MSLLKLALSAAQYELQFKKWGFAKNLKSGEWAALISQYDLLCQSKTDVRITVSGSVISKNKIDRARRRYRRPRYNRSRGALCGGGSISLCFKGSTVRLTLTQMARCQLLAKLMSNSLMNLDNGTNTAAPKPTTPMH